MAPFRSIVTGDVMGKVLDKMFCNKLDRRWRTVYCVYPGEQDFKQDSSVFLVQTSYPVGVDRLRNILEGIFDG